MSYLTDDERAAVQAISVSSGGSRTRRAEALVNPASGLANDYLNLFNEIVMLLEQLLFHGLHPARARLGAGSLRPH